MTNLIEFEVADALRLDQLDETCLRRLVRLLVEQQNATTVAGQMLLDELGAIEGLPEKAKSIVGTFADCWNEISVECSNGILEISDARQRTNSH
jgi:hypothetical protein